MPFLTLEDPNAKIKGSRDSLGTTPIWANFARHIISNLTTQTTSVRGFTILLLGRYLGAQLIEMRRLPADSLLEVILRMELIGGHVRHAAHGIESDIRGIERIKAFQEQDRGRVSISTDQRGLILSDQKVTGLWGLYTVSAERSGLIPEDRRGVTEEASRFIEENYIPLLKPVMPALLKLLERGGTLETRRKDPVFTAMAKVLPETYSGAEVEFYRKHLCDAEGTSHNGRQSRFRSLLGEHTNLEDSFNREDMEILASKSQPTDEGLSRYLQRIGHLEALIAPAAALFDYVLTQNGQTPSSIAARIRELWGRAVPRLDAAAFEDLLPEVRERFGVEIATAMHACHGALRTGDYDTAVRKLLKWNAIVMSGRKAGPWATLTPDGRIDIRYRGLEHLLPAREDLPALWYNSYFVDSIKSLLSQLRNVA